MSEFNIMFMGTPEFAVSSLDALVSAGFRVCAVITQPDKPKGRKMILTPPPVKVYAAEKGIDVLQPTTLRGDDFAAVLDKYAPNLIVVAAYGKILPQNVLDYPKYGCINVHGSLLPLYRGAAPIQRALMDGMDKTGVTIMKMDNGVDTGDMLLKAETQITDSDDFGTLHDRLAQKGGEALLDALEKLEKGTLRAEKQPDTGSSYAPKITNDDMLLDFSQPCRQVFNRIRGLSPFPLALTTLNGAQLKICASAPSDETTSAPDGTVVSADGKRGRFGVSCGGNILYVTSVLPAGKGRMSAGDFIRGRKIKVGDVLGV